MSVSALVIVPTYNEKANLPVLIAGLVVHDNVRVLVVDDQSPDGTGALAEELGRQYPGRVSVLHRTAQRGFGRSYIDGMKRAITEPVDVICQMDADLSHDPKQLPDLIAATAHADVVIGSRYIPGGAVVNWPLKRRLLSRFANIYVRLVTRLRARDCTSGYRCWRKSAMVALPLDEFVSDGYTFLVELLFIASRRGARIAEVPITFVERREGQSKMSGTVIREAAMTPWRLIGSPQSSRKSYTGEPAMTGDFRAFYAGRRVMITGGLGFIGSNLARQLVALGANVLIVDALIPDYGGNLFNIDGIADRVQVNTADLRQRSVMNTLVTGHEVIFNLAGQVSHIDSMRNPEEDLEINCRSHLTILEACRSHNPGVKVVYASTRQLYGRPDSLPVTETHLVRPTDVNGINKAAGEYYHLVYNNVFGIRACSLRLTNVYGPRQLIRHNRQGFIGWFIRLALDDATIQIYGDGSQIRDFVYVDDATDAFLRAGATAACDGEVFNVGGSEPISHRDLTTLLVDVAGSGRVEYIPWPAEKKAIDIGSFHADSSKFMRTAGWTPAVSLRDGLTRTLAYYRANREHYVEPLGSAVRS